MPQPNGTGRPKGAKNKRTLEGQDYARDILVQDDEHLVMSEDGLTVLKDNHPLALTNPVYRRLRAQAREGVGNTEGKMPPNVLVALADRTWGKVVDRVKLEKSRAKAYEGSTDAELAARAAALAEALGKPVEVAS